MAILTKQSMDSLGDNKLFFGLASIVLAASLVTWILFKTRPKNSEFWKSQSWVGSQNESLKGMRASSEDGYDRFSKSGQAFVLPTFASDPWVVLPPSATKELLNKTDAEVDAEVIHDEQIQRWYTQGKMGIHTSHNPIQFDVVRRQLTRKLPLLTAAVQDELRVGFETYWGTDSTQLKKVNVYRTCMMIVSRAANRVFVGDQLCRDEAFLDHCRMYTEGLFGGASRINLYSKLLRPIVAPWIMRSNRKHELVCKQACLPIVKDRLYHTMKKSEDEKYDWTPPIDALQWLVEDCIKTDDPKQLDPEIISFRLVTLNMVAIHTTGMTITNAILELYSSPDAEAFVAGIREECTRVLERHNGMWSKQAINELYRIDSTIRESMRRSDLSPVAVPRMVTAPGGVTFQGNIHVPKGVKVCVPSHAIHRDETCYPSAHVFDAFRFSRPREENDAQSPSKETTSPISDDSNNSENGTWKRNLEVKNTSAITTTDDFLGFGHGRHACPGRFFAIQELKLMLAHLVMNYDIEPISKRPEPVFINGSRIAPGNAWISIKKREKH